MTFEKLTAEQMEKAKNCDNVEELVILAKEEGSELSDEQLDAIAGGKWGFDGNGECGTPFLGSDK